MGRSCGAADHHLQKYRYDIDLRKTLEEMDVRLYSNDNDKGLFKSASEICEVPLYPEGKMSRLRRTAGMLLEGASAYRRQWTGAPIFVDLSACDDEIERLYRLRPSPIGSEEQQVEAR